MTAVVFKEPDLPGRGNTFRIMTPQTAERTAFQIKSRPDPGAVMNRKPFCIK
jgi:hypothetical protein